MAMVYQNKEGRIRKGKSYNVGWVYKCTVVSKVFLLKKIGKKIE